MGRDLIRSGINKEQRSNQKRGAVILSPKPTHFVPKPSWTVPHSLGCHKGVLLLLGGGGCCCQGGRGPEWGGGCPPGGGGGGGSIPSGGGIIPGGGTGG